jgi:hypothetical protein
MQTERTEPPGLIFAARHTIADEIVGIQGKYSIANSDATMS